MKTNLREEVADLQQANLVKLLIILVLLIAGVAAAVKIDNLCTQIKALQASETQVVAKLDMVCEVVLDQRRLLHVAYPKAVLDWTPSVDDACQGGDQ